MGTLEDVLTCILDWKRDPLEIASELHIPPEKVYDAIKILESLGYMEEIKKGSEACALCPIRKVCGGSCVVPKASAYKLTEKSFLLKDRQ
ncbi:DNA-binding protein [Thermococcus sp.]